MLRMPTAEDAIKAIALHLGIDRDAGLLDIFRAIDKDASSRVAALEQRIAELEANLVRYGEHEVIDGQFACAAFDDQPCNCGFEAALARLREVKG